MTNNVIMFVIPNFVKIILFMNLIVIWRVNLNRDNNMLRSKFFMPFLRNEFLNVFEGRDLKRLLIFSAKQKNIKLKLKAWGRRILSDGVEVKMIFIY